MSVAPRSGNGRHLARDRPRPTRGDHASDAMTEPDEIPAAEPADRNATPSPGIPWATRIVLLILLGLLGRAAQLQLLGPQASATPAPPSPSASPSGGHP